VVEELYTPEQLDQIHQQLWQCVLRFANFSATQERNRIARDWHDSLGDALTALNFQLQSAIKLCKPDPSQAQEFLKEAHRLVTLTTQEVRRTLKRFRNDEIENQSIKTLIQLLVHDFESITGVSPEVEINLPITLPSELVTPIYRIIQEALDNICKYAQATAVQIDIHTNVKWVHCVIQDNGCGFDPQKISGGYGLRGMKERVAVLQGHFKLETEPRYGCRITVDIPMQIPRKPEQYQEPSLPEMQIPRKPEQEQETLLPEIPTQVSHTQIHEEEYTTISLDELAEILQTAFSQEQLTANPYDVPLNNNDMQPGPPSLEDIEPTLPCLQENETDYINNTPLDFIHETDYIDNTPLDFVHETDYINNTPLDFIHERDYINNTPLDLINETDYINNTPLDLTSESRVTISDWQPLNLNEWHNLTLQKSTFFWD
jgi:two-component sensor histidine kinase